MKLLHASLLVGALAWFGLAAAQAPHFGAPPAEIRNQPTTLHGMTASDPYRWLEEVQSASVKTWLGAQANVARGVLDRIDGREAIQRRIAELADAQGDSIWRVLRLPGERLYYMKRFVGERQFKLVMRVGDEERVLVDPDRLAERTGVPHAVNFFRPSWDGRYLAYGISAGGSENASLHVIEVATGRTVAGPIPRAADITMHWLPDSRSLTFTQYRQLAKDEPDTEAYKDSRVLWLRVDRRGAKPQAVFGPKVTRQLGLDRLDVGEIHIVPGSRWMVARTTDTTVPEGKLFVAPLSSLGQPKAPWRRIADESNKVSDVALRGEHLYVLHRKDAPRRQLVRVDLARGGTLATAERVALPPAEGVLEEFTLTRGAVLAEVRQGTSVVLRRYEVGDTAGRAIEMPGAGAAVLARSPAMADETVPVAFSRWTEPLRWFRVDGAALQAVSFGREAQLPPLPEITVTEVTFPSHDGVKVPMTILHRKGLALDGRNAVLLEGYGSYGISTQAFFSAPNMAWLERGGVLAHVNPRGSGVYGDDWHRAGFKATKPNTWKDGIAAARWLIANGYGSAKTMGIKGTSAGGIFVGRAVTEAPELFAAAIFDVGVLDALRAEESANGATNISEFGTMKEPAEFKALLEMSTYHQVKEGVDYPAVLMVHGMNDPRVDVWHSAKTTARMQAANPKGRPVLLRLDMQAGHGMGSTITQRQALAADQQAFLLWQAGKLGLKD